ncbi:hypothetical protein [Leptospira alexanderi]|nr:hypothetical protein [Leptospira alexanderi]
MNLFLKTFYLLIYLSVLGCGKTNHEDQREKDFKSRLLSIVTAAENGQNQNPNNDSYYVGGTITGLALSSSVIIQNNNSDLLTINLNGVFRFAKAYKNGDSYSVTVLTQPNAKICTIPNGVGSISGTSVFSILITCQ